jgi:hypothetical protein
MWYQKKTIPQLSIFCLIQSINNYVQINTYWRYIVRIMASNILLLASNFFPLTIILSLCNYKRDFLYLSRNSYFVLLGSNCVHIQKRLFYPLANEVAKGYSNATVRPSHPCEHSRINILQWILTKLGTYLVLTRVWNPIDFQGQKSRSPGQIFTA